MSFDHGLTPGTTLDNSQLSTLFKCSTQGGMRRSKRTNCLVLISDPTKSLYEDRWENGIIHYTGMGLVGDQDVKFHQNKTLAESNKNGVELHLFEVYKPKNYLYRGQVDLTAEPYKERQLDVENNLRQVWIFPLKVLGDGQNYRVPEKLIEEKEKFQEKQVRKLTDEELRTRAANARKSNQRQSMTTTYDRDPFVLEYAKRRANGVCQLCEKPAPFKSKNGEPYLETHHIDWLSRGGPDTIENTVALCPNCHKKMHVVDNPQDVAKLKQKAIS